MLHAPGPLVAPGTGITVEVQPDPALRWEKLVEDSSPDELLRIPTTPLATDTHRPWSILTMRPDEARTEQRRRTLATGRRVHAAEPRTIGSGVNGALRLDTFVDRHSGERVKGVLKPISAGGAQELFASEVARAIRMEHLVPAVGRRSDGTAAIEFRPGMAAWMEGVDDGDTLELALRHSHELHDPGADAATIARRARIDRQLTQTFDFLLANGDRNGNNALFDARRGVVSLIDHGLIDRYGTADGRPIVLEDYMKSADAVRGTPAQRITIPLDDEVVELLRRADRTHIAKVFRQMLRDQHGAPSVGALAHRTKPEFLDQLLARLDDAILRRAIQVVAM